MANITSYQQALTDGTTTVKQTVEGFLSRIETEKHLNAFLEVYSEEALIRASKIDQKISNGTAGRLAGVVVGIKDNICYEGHQGARY